MSYQKIKARLREQTEQMESEMFETWGKGISMEILARKYGFTDRRAVWYHINKARKRRDTNDSSDG